MIERLLPAVVASAETRDQILEIELFPEEEHAVGRAVEKRRHEFITGRACARQALRELGIPATSIPAGERGEPIWPAGVVGSITHCRGYTACAAAHERHLLALGIDAEPNRPLSARVAAQVASAPEREAQVSDPDLHITRLVFSAKEAVYKAWYSLTGRWLSFEQVQVSFQRGTREFSATPTGRPSLVEREQLDAFRGRWSLCDGVILTTVVVPRERV